VKNIILLLAAIIFSCFLAEAIARLLFPQWAPRTARITHFWKHDPRYGWSHVANTTGRFSSFGFDTKVTINSKGFRGPAFPYEQDLSRKRAVVLGDSFVWGYGVEYEDTFIAALSHEFPQLELVNLGVSGYSIDQELLLYVSEGRRYKPDLVIVVVAANDTPNHLKTNAYLIYGKPAFVVQDGQLNIINQPVPQTHWIKRAAVKLAWNSHILTQLHRYLTTHASSATQKPLERQVRRKVDDRPFPRYPAEELTARLLVELKRETVKDGAQFLVVFVDGMDEAGLFAEYLLKFQAESILLDRYIDHADRSLHLPDQIHWTPAGHKLAAGPLSTKIREMLYGIPATQPSCCSN
jgi:GDSL-like Lipase/Acylhydrolase family